MLSGASLGHCTYDTYNSNSDIARPSIEPIEKFEYVKMILDLSDARPVVRGA